MVLGNLGLSQEVPKEEALELTNGLLVRSVLELLEALKSMDNEIYGHHVREHYNDFAEWIIENYHNETLYIKILHTNTRKRLIHLLERELKKELQQFTRTTTKAQGKEPHIIQPLKRKKDILKTLKKTDG